MINLGVFGFCWFWVGCLAFFSRGRLFYFSVFSVLVCVCFDISRGLFFVFGVLIKFRRRGEFFWGFGFFGAGEGLRD